MKTHDYEKYADGYAQFKIDGTVYQLFKDLENMTGKYGGGGTALDYGCGTGDGIGVLKKMGYKTMGVDISQDMLVHAQERDPEGTYLHIDSAELPDSWANQFDVVILTTVLTEISDQQGMLEILLAVHKTLKEGGVVIISNCSAECYHHNWLSFQCDFPENKHLISGQNAKIYFPEEDVTLYDYYWTSADYLKMFEKTLFTLEEQLYSTVTEADKGLFPWETELTKSAWCTYVLRK